jgi:phosphoglycolate phosphatase
LDKTDSVERTRINFAAFDLDGTLVDTMADLTDALNRTLAMLGARELPPERVRALVGHGFEQLIHSGLAESLGTKATRPEQQSAASALARRIYAQGVFKRSQVYPGVTQALQSLAAAGVGLCCITNKDSAFSEPLLQQAGLAGYFAFTLCADRPEDRKPSPRMLLAACSRFGVTPAQMLYVGDSPIDIEAARAAGCPVIMVTYGYGRRPLESEPQPDQYVATLTDLDLKN